MKRTPLKVLIDFMRSYSEHEALDEALDSIHEALAIHPAGPDIVDDAVDRLHRYLVIMNLDRSLSALEELENEEVAE